MWSLIAPLLLVSAVLPTIAEELDAKDVPAACITICTPVVMLSNACDVELDDAEEEKLEQQELAQQQRHNYLVTATTYAPPRATAGSPHRRKRDDSAKDQAERFCMCRNTSFDVEGVTGLCASCLAQHGGPDAVDDVNEIMADCAFSSTTYAPSATTAAMDLTIVAMIPTLAAASGNQASSSSSGGSQGGRTGLGSDASSRGTPGRPFADSRTFMYLFTTIALAIALQ